MHDLGINHTEYASQKLLEQEEEEDDQNEPKDHKEAEDSQDDPVQETFNEKTNASEIRQR